MHSVASLITFLPLHVCKLLNSKKFVSIGHGRNLRGGGKFPSKFFIHKDSFLGGYWVQEGQIKNWGEIGGKI